MQKLLSRKHWTAFVGVLAGTTVAILASIFWKDIGPIVGFSKPLTAQEIVTRDLTWATEEGAADVGARLAPVHDVFSHARQGVRAFADDALGWDSKWSLITDFVSSGNDHATFLKEKFSERLFSPNQLEKAAEASVDAYLKHLEDVDSQLLVRLQADLSDLPTENLPPGIDRAAISQLIDSALNDAKKAAELDFGGMIGREVASLVAGEILAAAAIELGTSTGILSAGAASGTVTFGAGLVVGIIADYAVSWAYDKLFDPAGELTKRVNQQLDQLEQLILVGNRAHPGLQMRLQDYAMRRSKARDVAIKAAIFRPTQTTAL
jgi:hypothetical protein